MMSWYLVTLPTLSVELLVDGESCTWTELLKDKYFLQQGFFQMVKYTYFLAPTRHFPTDFRLILFLTFTSKNHLHTV